MTRDDIRKLAAEKLPCVGSVCRDDAAYCEPCQKRPAIEAAIIEAVYRALVKTAAEIVREAVGTPSPVEADDPWDRFRRLGLRVRKRADDLAAVLTTEADDDPR